MGAALIKSIISHRISNKPWGCAGNKLFKTTFLSLITTPIKYCDFKRLHMIDETLTTPSAIDLSLRWSLRTQYQSHNSLKIFLWGRGAKKNQTKNRQTWEIQTVTQRSTFYITQNNSLYGVSMLSFMAVDWARENKGAGGREGGVIKMWQLWQEQAKCSAEEHHTDFSISSFFPGWQLNVYHMQYLFSSCVRLSSCPREYKECHLLE